MKNKLAIWWLTGIVILAFVLRFFDVTKIPPSLNWDEVAIGYNAYSILKTGKDEWGQFFPLHFKSYGEYKLPAQIYASIPGVAIFGLNELGVRIAPIVYGTLTVLLVYFLALEIFEIESVGLMSAFLLSISPWHIQLTRASFESSFSVFWVVMGIWFLTKGFKNSKWWIYSMIPFAISVYTYNSARVFTPVFLLIVTLIFRKQLFKERRNFFYSLVLFILLMLPLIPFLLQTHGTSRYKLVSITDDPGLVPRIDEYRANSSLPNPIKILIFNRVTFSSLYFSQNYLEHFSPNFLFFSGAPHKQHHVQGIGELYLFQAPVLLLGLYYLFKTKDKYRPLLLAWFFLTFVPVSTTNDSIPNALRTAIATPFYQIISALGAYFVWEVFKRRHLAINIFLIGASVVIIGISLIKYLNLYYLDYPKLYSRDWQYGYKQVEEYIKQNQDKYNKIYMTDFYGQPYMFTLFYQSYDPAKFQQATNLVRYPTKDFIRIESFDKYYFPDFSKTGTTYSDIVKQNKGQKILLVGREEDFPVGLKSLMKVNFLNGVTAFNITEAP